jgi:hypothetical protein
MQRLIPAVFAALGTLPSRSRNLVVRRSLAFQPSLRRESETQTREMTDGQAIDSAVIARVVAPVSKRKLPEQRGAFLARLAPLVPLPAG